VQLGRKPQDVPRRRVRAVLGFDEDDEVEIAETPCQ
jgi:hypothetical protein